MAQRISEDYPYFPTRGKHKRNNTQIRNSNHGASTRLSLKPPESVGLLEAPTLAQAVIGRTATTQLSDGHASNSVCCTYQTDTVSSKRSADSSTIHGKSRETQHGDLCCVWESRFCKQNSRQIPRDPNTVSPGACERAGSQAMIYVSLSLAKAATCADIRG